METYTDTLPPLWWLRPWHHARRLHAAVTALRDRNSDLEKDLDFHKEDRSRAWHELDIAGIDEVDAFSVAGGIAKIRDQRDAERATVEALNKSCFKLEADIQRRIRIARSQAGMLRKPVYVKKGNRRA